jgi:hypothetical protein
VFGTIKRLSYTLQEELQVSIRRNSIKKVAFFKKFSDQLIQRLVLMMDYVSFTPEENIIFVKFITSSQENFPDDGALYVIISGTVRL